MDKKEKIVRYEDNYFTYIWKPANIPTTFWKEKSFLEMLLESEDKKIQSFFQRQKEFFWEEEEYGLLNRLDTPTSWLLTFAKTPLFAEQYKILQSENKIEKNYLAEVKWFFPHKELIIDYPIAHSKTSWVRMLVLNPDLSEKKLKILEKKSKKRKHYVKTFLELLYYDKEKDISVVKAIIHKGIRHQIRTHLASIGFPIMWDKIYGKKIEKEEKNLQLYCLGMEIK